MQGIDYVAWWGAVVATLVLLWDVVKWVKTGPKIRKRIQLDTYYPDSEVLKVEKLGSDESRVLASYCHIELVNAGTLPTTIMGISASHTNARKCGKLTISNEAFTPHYEKFPPYVLPPGEVWSCRLKMSDLYRLAESGKPYIEVHASHKHKPVVIWPKLMAKKEDAEGA